MLGDALADCPDSLWDEPVWPETPPEWFAPNFAHFWYVVYHSLVWLDLYLEGRPEDEFAPPQHFRQGEVDSPETMPERPYTKEQLGDYLQLLRVKCREKLVRLTAEDAGQTVQYGWSADERVTYAELLLYNLRHVQGHAAQLSLFLGSHGVPSRDWVARVPD